MFRQTRAWFPACLIVLVAFGPGTSSTAQERKQVQPAELKGEGVYNAVEGTTTIVCGSWLNRSIDFHNGTSFFCKRSNSAESALETSGSDISALLNLISQTNRAICA